MHNANEEYYEPETTIQDLKKMTNKIVLRLEALKRRVERSVSIGLSKMERILKRTFSFPRSYLLEWSKDSGN